MRGASNAWIVLIVGMAAAMVGGCSLLSLEDANFYLLLPQAAKERHPLPTDTVVVLNRIALAPYLDSTRLLLQQSDNRLQQAADRVWAESLQDNIQRVVALNLAARLQLPRVEGPSYRGEGFKQAWRVSLAIDYFHGSMVDGIELHTYWQLHYGDKATLLQRQEQIHVVTGFNSYDRLVEGMSRALAELADRIATAVAQSINSRQ
ncbi:membrane integrity-associated transporter subunit PqiC [Ectothiorhodospiraceae bacterium BW-2]|nr:membrane integrity-associated transporter subunit PqiC [Ectothiorhodospiraceae bacterium BW-2]